MKIAVIPNNINNLDKYIKCGCNTFILGLKDYSVNYYGITIDEIKNIFDKYSDIEVFISVNKTIFNSELNDLENKLIELNNIPVKGVLFYDLGILSLYQQHKFNYSLVWHQTHMVTNYNTVNYYYDKGASYAYLAGEITSEEMVEIKNKTKSKLFATIIGHPIMAHSRRGLLTNYYESQDRTYNGDLTLISEKDSSYIVTESKDGTCIYDEKIVNGIDYIEELSILDYGVIHGFNMNEELLIKLISLVDDVIRNNSDSSKEKIKELIGNNTGFFNKKTIFKVKKDEKKN